MSFDSFRFKLRNTAEYHFEGMLCSTDTLVLYEPAEKHRAYAVPLQMRYTKILLDFANSTAKKRDDSVKIEEAVGNKEAQGLDADSILMLTMGSSALSKNEFLDMMSDFRGLMLSPDICLLDNKLSITASIFDLLPMRDKNKLFAEYLSNFMSPSMLTQKLT